MKRFALLAAAAFFAFSAHAQIYQWKDASGKTVISDKPPVGAVQQQKTLGASSPSTSPAQKSLAEREMEFKQRQKESQDIAEKNRKEEASAAEKQENCNNARRQLQMLESGERIALRDEKGERYFMEDAQREQEIAKARKFLESSCK
ncbi:DUF4124 domain-containing protein [Propionivibrio sp.]|jgi:hypothetical protein|uniref:DUF4124 domain-containing protein n=1 Tax=Propionivibrio sp. TaxID=2212460 RepID=UPI00272E3D61|nr:DUF4124 domain-containing protein [Propionivibrio sp.]